MSERGKRHPVLDPRRLTLGRALDVELHTYGGFRNWSLHVWVFSFGVHLFTERGALPSRVIFERDHKEALPDA